MIREIINFIEELPQEILNNNLKPKEGLYVLLDIDNDGNLLNIDENGKINQSDIGKYTEKDDEENNLTEHILNCKNLFLNSQVMGKGTNKSFNSSSGLFSITATPFGIGFSKKNYANPERDRSKEYINNQIEAYFKAANPYLDGDEKYLHWRNKLKQYLLTNMYDYIANNDLLSDVKQNENVFFFLKDPALKDYKIVNQKYFAKSIFNETLDSKNGKVGIYANTHNFNEDKIFLKHKTGLTESVKWVSGDVATQLESFYSIQKYLPNPFPLFVYKEEAENAIKILKNDGKIQYVEMIKSILGKDKDELHNFYLLFFRGSDYSRIADMDFIPSFKYKTDIVINTIFPISRNNLFHIIIDNVFDFEKYIAFEVLNKPEDTHYINYFGEEKIKNEKSKRIRYTQNGYNQFLKYRKAFYDYIYKSRKEALTQTMFDDILLKGVIDDIQHDEYKHDTKINTKRIPILNKINIWFSLYNYFNDSNQNKREDMITKIERHRNVIDAIISDETKLLSSDDEFAYASGHCIRYLFSKSETKDKSYNRLEAFLQKTDSRLFQKAIANFFAMYKHKNMTDKFGRVFSQVMNYETEANMKDFLPEFLSGFFDYNKLFSVNEQEEIDKDEITEQENEN